jgi:hypothetical protein
MQDRSYWFAAKRYGWGWGLPLTWQGWVVYALWIAVLLGSIRFLHLRQHPFGHVAFLIGMIAVLLGICFWKGEPARWRWGDKKGV